MQLTAENVKGLIMATLYKPEELPAPGVTPPEAVVVNGVVRLFGFHPERLKAKKEEIRGLLSQLNDDFMVGKGGGMSFLNLCYDREERHWGEHRDCDDLICLGIAVGMASFAMPREHWKIFPGDMPYIIVDTSKP